MAAAKDRGPSSWWEGVAGGRLGPLEAIGEGEGEPGLAAPGEQPADGGPFPDRLHIIALFARFYADLVELVIGWADLAEAEIQAWPRTNSLGLTEQARSLLEEMAARPPAHSIPSSASSRRQSMASWGMDPGPWTGLLPAYPLRWYRTIV